MVRDINHMHIEEHTRNIIGCDKGQEHIRPDKSPRARDFDMAYEHIKKTLRLKLCTLFNWMLSKHYSMISYLC